MKTVLFTQLTLASTALLMTACASTSRVYFGTQKSKGIYFADFDAQTGELSTPALAAETKGCGFIAIHPNKELLYSTGTTAFKINTDGSLTELNTQTTEGGGACHVSLDKTGQCVMTAHYGGGAVASYQIQDDGSLSAPKSFFKHEGSGTHPKRQKKAYAHSVFVNPANTHAYAADLGIDKIMIYQLDPKAGTLSAAGFAEVPGGSMGPRHMKWNQDGSLLYLLNELDLSVSIFKAAENGQLEFVKTASTLPEGGDKSEMTCAEIRIHPNGRFIYASNRDLTEQGRDSISVFTRFEDGFERLETTPAQVWIPRNFNIDPTGKWMLVGGMKSHNIALFEVDQKTGRLTFTEKKVPFEGGPICIEFLD
ncbi:6-phosphogluconolactonase [Pontiella desulfatans]|uniref:6-phosphogluconolactonase n=1 Tax=Pontiella desulfatans TaxID=2750659 RepID=A0A6C2UAF6_PONDE|nr:lactonase family protein [Pontiella desulfatans]VGO16501.1 6-phosphogluconolactonase [Pontiella desulfatans]